ncbi:hypothetical protein FJ251_09735 [bacterium]|nr:hypothetical protein [bacterium]
MKRRSLLSLVCLIVLLMSLGSPVAEARTPPKGPEDYQPIDVLIDPSIGDDDDDGANIASPLASLVATFWSTIRWLAW